jgi:phage major head subunit gpT-like protein
MILKDNFNRLSWLFALALIVVAVLCCGVVYSAAGGPPDPQLALLFGDPSSSWLMGFGLSGLIITPDSVKSLFRGYKANYQEGFNSISEPEWKRLATLVPSGTASETYGWLGQWPRLREWIGDRQLLDLTSYGYTIKNKPFESTVKVGRDEIEDDAFGLYAPMMNEMGRAAADHPTELIYALVQAGFNAPCYDGQYFFDTDHPMGSGVTFNMIAGANNPWFLLDLSRGLKPFIYQRRKPYAFVSLDKEDDQNVFMRKEFIYGVDGRGNAGYGLWQFAFGSKSVLDQANVNLARTTMMTYAGDQGRPIGVKPGVLLVGPSNLAAAEDVVKKQYLANGASNTLFNAFDIFQTPYLL